MKPLRIATRMSPLALWQSEFVASQLRAAYPKLEVSLVPLSTRGDEILDRSLAAIGGKGLFLKELEIAMERGEADLAVHSLKDVPMDLEAGFVLGAILTREDSADALISNSYNCIAALPSEAIVGSSSLRRQAQLRALRPDLKIVDLRGNVNTRLAKLDGGEYDAIILAIAGLKRLGMESRVTSRLVPPSWLPAPAQGAIAIECLSNDAETLALVGVLNDPQTALQVEAERAMNRALHGSCHVPVAALATIVDQQLHLVGCVSDVQTGQNVRAEGSVALDTANAADVLGKFVADALIELGAREYIDDHV